MRDTATSLSLCRLCPKLCHSSCPVADADPAESTTPWGKMSAMKMIDQGGLSNSHLALAYKCLHCGLSQQACELDNPVADVLTLYRAKAYVGMVAPKPVYDFCQKFALFNNPYAKDLKKILMRHLPHEMSNRPKKGLYFPGCAEINFRPQGIKPTLDFLAELGDCKLGIYQEPIQCCGLPLLQAGDLERFREMAEVNSHLLNRFDFIVSNDPDCLYTLKHHYEAQGFPIRAKIYHFTQYVWPLLVAREKGGLLRHTERPARQGMAYHDPCQLGRRLGVYEEPRRILEFITGAPPLEFFRQRSQSYCCGAGGLLPVTFPDLSQRVTKNRWEEFGETGAKADPAKVLVTASLNCQLKLQEESQIPVMELKDYLVKFVYG